MKKLHLGCGSIRLKGYVNVDIRPGDAVDVVADLKNLTTHFEQEYFDEIYNCAVLEHFGRHEWMDLIKHWTSFLKPGGKLFTSTTDFDAIVSRYQTEKNLEEVLGLLVGGQKYKYDWHGVVFNYKVLEEALISLGYKEVKKYDWQKHDVGKLGVDDFSQAYLPHMDKENGRLMVLNICGTKI